MKKIRAFIILREVSNLWLPLKISKCARKMSPARYCLSRHIVPGGPRAKLESVNHSRGDGSANSSTSLLERFGLLGT
jgi:hypothetical protein